MVVKVTNVIIESDCVVCAKQFGFALKCKILPREFEVVCIFRHEII